MSKRRDRVLRHLLSRQEAQPAEAMREETRAAFAHRAVALLAWLKGDTARMESEMLASAERFLALGNRQETAVSRTLLGFCLAERSPALALACVETGLAEMDEGFWLRPLAEVVAADCLFLLGERSKERQTVDEQDCGEICDPVLSLKLHWVTWRLCGRLGDPFAGVELAKDVSSPSTARPLRRNGRSKAEMRSGGRVR